MLTRLEVIQHLDFDAVWMQVRHQITDQAECQTQYPFRRHLGDQVQEPVYDQVGSQIEFQLSDQMRESF